MKIRWNETVHYTDHQSIVTMNGVLELNVSYGNSRFDTS
jgi:hypothetical protein